MFRQSKSIGGTSKCLRITIRFVATLSGILEQCRNKMGWKFQGTKHDKTALRRQWICWLKELPSPGSHNDTEQDTFGKLSESDWRRSWHALTCPEVRNTLDKAISGWRKDGQRLACKYMQIQHTKQGCLPRLSQHLRQLRVTYSVGIWLFSRSMNADMPAGHALPKSKHTHLIWISEYEHSKH